MHVKAVAAKAAVKEAAKGIIATVAPLEPLLLALSMELLPGKQSE